MRKGGDRYYHIWDKELKRTVCDCDGDYLDFDYDDDAQDYIINTLADAYELTEEEAEKRFEVECLRW